MQVFCWAGKTATAKLFIFRPYVTYTSSNLFAKFQENQTSGSFQSLSQNTGTLHYTIGIYRKFKKYYKVYCLVLSGGYLKILN